MAYTAKYEKGEIVIRVPVTDKTAAEAPVSSSGKSRMIANSGGFIPIDGAPEGVRFQLNVIGKLNGK